MRYWNQEDFRQQERVRDIAIQQKAKFVQLPNIANLTNFQVVLNADPTAGGATISFKLVNSIAGMSSIRLLRSDINAVTAAQIIHTWPVLATDLTKTFSFVDVAPILALKINYYWLQINPTVAVAESPGISLTSPQFIAGPQILNQMKGSQLPPAQIQSFAVALGAGSNGFQPVYVNWLAPKDPNFAYLRIVVAGFNGQPNEQFLPNGLSSPYPFTMLQTGQTVTLKAEAVSLTGMVNTSSPLTASITLNGTATVPAALFSVTATKVGGGTNGIQVDFDAGLESITTYTIYRSAPGAGSGSSSSIGTVTPSAGTNHYTYLDSTAINQNFDYYVKPTNAIGTGGFSNTATSQGVADRRGNVVFSVTDGFSYASTDTTLTWTWTGITIYRSDGSTTSVPNGSQAITGLTASTIYKFFPYWDEISLALVWVSIGSTTGSPAYAYAPGAATLAVVQQQELLSHISLAGAGMSASTTAAAAPPAGGTGGGGGGGGCFTSKVKVKTISGYIEFGSMPFVVEVLNETGVHLADLIIHENYSGHVIELGPGQLVTVDHMMKVGADEWIPAHEFYKKKPVYFEGTVYNLHIRSTEEADHHYILENGDVAHNVTKLSLF